MEISRYLIMRTALSLKQEEEWFDEVSRDRNTVHWTIVRNGTPIGVPPDCIRSTG